MNRREFKNRVEFLRLRWLEKGPPNPGFDPKLPTPLRWTSRPNAPHLPFEVQVALGNAFHENVPNLDALPSWTWFRLRAPSLENGRLDEEAFWLAKEQLWAIREDLADKLELEDPPMFYIENPRPCSVALCRIRPGGGER